MQRVLASKGFVIFLSIPFLGMFGGEADKYGNVVPRSSSSPCFCFPEGGERTNKSLLSSYSCLMLEESCIEVSIILIFPNKYELDGVCKEIFISSQNKNNNYCHDDFCDALERKMTSKFDEEKNPFYFFYINQKLTCLTVCGDEPNELGVFLGKIKMTFPRLVQVISFGICGCPNLEISRGTVMISLDYRRLHRVTGVAELLRKKGKTPFLSQGNNHFLSKFFKEIKTSVVLEKITDILNRNNIPHVPCHNCTVFELLSDPILAEELEGLLSECVIVNQEDSCCYEVFGEKFLPIRVVSDHCGRDGADELEENKSKVLKTLCSVALLIIRDVIR